MIEKDVKYSYNDLSIIPTAISPISSRSECNPCQQFSGYDNMLYTKFLPLFTAPMDSVVNKNNFGLFLENNIHPIMPRTESLEDRLEYARKGYWVAYSLSEFEEIFCNFIDKGGNYEDLIQFTEWYNCSFVCSRALIDIANGHMSKIYDLVKKAKENAEKLNYKIEVMIGNIANPETYYKAAKAGVDYIRCSIGSGAACITSTQTSVYYPIASLIDNLYQIKHRMYNDMYLAGVKDIKLPKIVADGGIRGYADIIKALALGADYVMVGSVFAKMWESAAPIINDTKGAVDKGKQSNILTEEKKRQLLKQGIILEKEYWGMSTKRSQALIKPCNKYKTSEGTKKIVLVEYTMEQWVENMKDYLKSAMSYTGHYTVDSFIGSPTLVVLSPQTRESINK